MDENARHWLRMGLEVLRDTGEEDNVKSSRIRTTLLALERGDDDPERGDVKRWVIITLFSAVLIAVLLALSVPVLAPLLSQVLDRFG